MPVLQRMASLEVYDIAVEARRINFLFLPDRQLCFEI